MKILITGISGRVGTALLHSLVAQNHQVCGYDILPPKEQLGGVQYFIGETLPAAALSGVDTVAHLGAFMSWNPRDHAELLRQNVQMTFELLELCAQAGISRFVFASTGEVYPEGAPQYLPIDEQHPCEPTSVYGETKKMGEELLRFFRQRRGLNTVILRLPHTQAAEELLNPNSFFSGPRFFLQAKIRQMQQLGNTAMVEELLPYERGKLQHILQCCPDGRPYQMHISDVRDTVAGLEAALFHPDAIGETFNIGFDEPVNFGQALEQMAEITGLEVVRIKMPYALHYKTSNQKAKKILSYKAQYSFARMLEEAAQFWHTQWK